MIPGQFRAIRFKRAVNLAPNLPLESRGHSTIEKCQQNAPIPHPGYVPHVAQFHERSMHPATRGFYRERKKDAPLSLDLGLVMRAAGAAPRET
jgi:hypothetical protein